MILENITLKNDDAYIHAKRRVRELRQNLERSIERVRFITEAISRGSKDIDHLDLAIKRYENEVILKEPVRRGRVS